MTFSRPDKLAAAVPDKSFAVPDKSFAAAVAWGCRDENARPQDAYQDIYHPHKVVVLDLDISAMDKRDIVDYFSNFGAVVGIVIKIKPTKVYAFLEFADRQGVETALAMAPHMVRQVPVRVLRAFSMPMPTRPFPGMDPLSSPLQHALAQEAVFGPEFPSVPRSPLSDLTFLARDLPSMCDPDPSSMVELVPMFEAMMM